MLKVFLVDDEYYERLSLKKAVPWDEHGFVVSGEANNGLHAYEMMKKDPPDIAIVDINMPKMNGLELISKLSEAQIPCRCIILTGYDEFKYAQQAIRLGVSDYILKPINYPNLINALDELKNDIEEQNRLTGQIQDLMSENERLFREQYYNDLVNCNFSIQTMRQCDEKLAARFIAQYSSYQVAVFELSAPPDPDKLRQLEESIRRSMEEDDFVCCLDNKRRLFFIFDESRSLVFPHLICRILELLRREGYEAAAGVGNPCPQADLLYRSYNEACIALQNCPILKQAVVVYQNIRTALPAALMDSKTKNLLRAQIIRKDVQQITTLLADIYRQLNDTASTWECALLETLELLNLLTEVLSSQAATPISLLDAQGSILDTLNAQKTIEGLCRWLTGIYTDAVRDVPENQEYSDITVCIEDYIKSHYQDPELSISAIAKALYLNYSYICYCFKRDKQMTINDYLNQVRIEKAIALFQDHVESIGFVAEKTGFTSASYFSKQFKKATGLPPSEYLKIL